MAIRILSASMEGNWNSTFQEVNILPGADAEDTVLTLAGIFGGTPRRNGRAKIQWDANTVLFVSFTDGGCIVEKVVTAGRNAEQSVKHFHKRRFLSYRDPSHILDCTELPTDISGASDLVLKKLKDALKTEDDRPLFIINCLERLDEAVDTQTILEAMNDSGRQVFVAAPHYHKNAL